MFLKLRDRQLSPEYSAPQFCKAWMEFAESQSKVKIRSMTIMFRGQKRDKKGNLVFSKKTGAPVITWVPYEGF